MGVFFILVKGCDGWPDAVPVGIVNGPEWHARLLVDGLRIEFQSESPALVFSYLKPGRVPEIQAKFSQWGAAREGEFGEQVEGVCRAFERQKILHEANLARKAGKSTDAEAPGEEDPQAGAITLPSGEMDQNEEPPGGQGNGSDNAGGAGEVDTNEVNREKPKKRKTRKKRSDPKADKKIAEAWDTGQYRTEAALAAELNKTEREVHLAKERHRKREDAKKKARK